MPCLEAYPVQFPAFTRPCRRNFTDAFSPISGRNDDMAGCRKREIKSKSLILLKFKKRSQHKVITRNSYCYTSAISFTLQCSIFAAPHAIENQSETVRPHRSANTGLSDRHPENQGVRGLKLSTGRQFQQSQTCTKAKFMTFCPKSAHRCCGSQKTVSSTGATELAYSTGHCHG